LTGYTDLHLHLIPGVDDGPENDEEAVELARVLVADGVTTVCVTPHFNAWNPERLSTADELGERVGRLRDVLSSADIQLEVLPGAEHFLTPELVSMVESHTAPLLASGPYILVEMPFNNRPLYGDDVMFSLALSGATPVLAHPERYSWVQKDPMSVQPLVDRGIVMQLTAASLQGNYGGRVRKTAETLLSRGLYSLVGSDLHHSGQPRLLSAMEAQISSLTDHATADRLFRENPLRVTQGEPLLPAPRAIYDEPKKGLFGRFGRG
jgi:protein-tyrosine phosphatase